MNLDYYTLFDSLIEKLDKFPLDMQFHLTKIQKIDSKLIKLNKKFDNLLKKKLKNENNFDLKFLNSNLEKLQIKREKSMKFVSEILNNILEEIDLNYTDELKLPLNFNLKQASFLKTKIDKKDIPEINQPYYCSCKGPAYGDMIRCDGNNCKILWFHFECVNLVSVPKNCFYCADCQNDKNLEILEN